MQPAVLLVDADQAACDALREILEPAGYTVTESDSGDAALGLLRVNLTRMRPHRLVVLLRAAPPQVDAATMLRAIAEDPHLATHHAYVVLTPVLGPTFEVEALELPNLQVVAMSPPYTPAELLDVVARAAGGLGLGSDGTSRRD
jgi:CheY-like chemotaxis protein